MSFNFSLWDFSQTSKKIKNSKKNFLYSITSHQLSCFICNSYVSFGVGFLKQIYIMSFHKSFTYVHHWMVKS